MTGWLAPLTLALTATSGASNGSLPPSQMPPAPLSTIIADAVKSAPVPILKLQGEPPLRLARLADSVETYHPMLAAANQRRARAQGEAMSARGGFDPVLKVSADYWPEGFYDFRRLEAKVEQATPFWGASLFGGYRIGTGVLPVYEEEARTLDDGEVKVGINVPLWRNGPIDERRAGIRQTEQGARAAGFDRDTTRLGLLLDSANAYWKWAAAGQGYRIAVDLLQLAELRDRQLAAKVRQGAVAEVDRAENLRAVLDRRQDLVVAQRALEQTAIKLSMFLRDDNGEPIVAAPSRLPNLPAPTPPNPVELERGREDAFSRRPEIDFYRAEVENARVGLRLAENQVFPEFDMQFSVGKDLGSNRDSKIIETLDPTEFKVGFEFKLPVLLRKARGKRAQAAAKLAEVREKARFQRDKIGAQILNLWSALQAQAEQSRIADETYRVAAAVAAAERRRFDLGATTLFIVNLREQKAAEAARKSVKARADYAVTRSAWALATKTQLSL